MEIKVWDCRVVISSFLKYKTRSIISNLIESYCFPIWYPDLSLSLTILPRPIGTGEEDSGDQTKTILNPLWQESNS
ncbi:hypothetical protein YC2023_001015 [Brassica napus]